MKNVTPSVKAKLQSLARKEGLSLQLILIRYFQERLLYRLSESIYRDSFVLKGGALIYAIGGIKTRFTKDLDFLSKDKIKSQNKLQKIIRQIVSMPYPADGVDFDSQSIETETIAAQNKYPGFRLHIEASLGNIKQRVQLDFGFDDVTVPDPQELKYPVLIEGFEHPVILAYSPETIIAEKLQAMIELSGINSRMKDFFDVYCLLNDQKLDKTALHDAIKATFENRKTIISKDHELFSDEFGKEESRLKMWQAFLKKADVRKDLDYSSVINLIREILIPLLHDNQ